MWTRNLVARGSSRWVNAITGIIGIAAALALVRAPALAADDPADPWPRDWEQEGGGPEHAGTSSMSPVSADPVVAWTQTVPGEFVAEPVSSNGVVYTLCRMRQGVELTAWRVSDGSRITARSIPDTSPRQRLAVAGSLVVVGGAEIRGYPLRGDGFGLAWRAKAGGVEGVVVTPDYVFTRGPEGLAAIAPSSGRVIVQLRRGPEPIGMAGMPFGRGVAVLEAGRVSRPRYDARFLEVESFAPGDGFFDPGPIRAATDVSVREPGTPPRAAQRTPPWVTWVRAARGAPSGDFAIVLGAGFPAAAGSDCPSAIVPQRGEPSICRLAHRPLARGGKLLGFTDSGALYEVAGDGSALEFVVGDKLPADARPGPASAMQYGAYEAWETAILAQTVETLAPLAQKAAGERLHTIARRLVAELREIGIDDARVRKIESVLGGFSEDPSARDKAPRYVRLEAEARAKLGARALAASA